MFDSLRRAEAARKRKQNVPPAEPAKPTIVPSSDLEPVANGTVHLDGVPDGFIRELGILKNALESALGKAGKRTLMFVSSTEGEGTTTIVTNYAKLLSLQAQQKVLLIEMNARRPSLFWKFGLKSNLGIAHYLEGRETLDAVVQQTAGGSFDVVHVGESDPVKIQIHQDRMLPSFLQSAHQRYDTVLIDAPPIIGSPETPPLSALADGIVVVVHCGKTKREIVQRSLGLIGQFDGNVLGVVLNRKKYYIPDFVYRRI
jgi:Mrp family chromosome partitioning ATPase